MTTELQSLTDPLAAWRGRRVLVAMSGGVDSSMAATLLHLAGADVVGVNMSLCHAMHEDLGAAPVDRPVDKQQAADAERIARRFGFDFHVVDLRPEFRQLVMDPFVEDYLNGRTPNPCVVCNRRLKLGRLLDRLGDYGAEAIATGHYARIRHNPETGRHELARPADTSKDQTYYLCDLTQEQLGRLVFPMGELTKARARELAREMDLHVHDMAESQDICFVDNGDYRGFVQARAADRLGEAGGDIVHVDGRVLGRHEGLHNYTIGQRRGLGIAAEAPLYVIELRPETREVVVGFREHTYRPAMILERMNWIAAPPSGEPFRARVKIRYRHPGALATVHPGPDATARIVFDEPIGSITPGQAAAAYDEAGETVLAGGWIARAEGASKSD